MEGDTVGRTQRVEVEDSGGVHNNTGFHGAVVCDVGACRFVQ